MLPVLMAQDVVTVWSYRRDYDRLTLATLLPGAALGIGSPATCWRRASRMGRGAGDRA